VRNVLISGVESVLGSYLAARCLAVYGDRVFCFSHEKDDVLAPDQRADFLIDLAREIAGDAALNAGEMRQRLRCAGGLHASQPGPGIAGIDIHEAWYLTNFTGVRNPAEAFEGVLSACAGMGAKEFNHVVFDAPGRAPADAQILRRCQAHGLRGRIFRASLILGGDGVMLEPGGGVLPRFLSTLHSFKAEIQERLPEYFDLKALRVAAPANALLNVAPVRLVSDVLVRVARADGTAGSSFTIASPENTTVEDFFDRVGIAYELSLLPVEASGDLNAVDRAFRERLKEAEEDADLYVAGGSLEFSAEAYAVAGLEPERAILNEQAQIEILESLRRNQDQALTARRRRAAELPARLEQKTIARDGAELNYYCGGKTGPAVVVLNALGQGLEYWYRLLDNLIEDHRVIIWEPRGTIAPPAPLNLNDQADDLEAVLRHEGIESCHRLGWCTGPKVALAFYLRRPQVVRSLAFLNASLKCDGSPEELDSAYERNVETLCRMVARQPSMAPAVRAALSPGEPSTPSKPEDLEEMSADVLALMNANLKASVLAPFKNDQTTLNYARQSVDFWSRDARPVASKVQVPVFLLSTEHDQVATPAASRAFAELLPWALHVHVKGATHYCFYDRPEFVAGMLRKFFADPDVFVAGQDAPLAGPRASTPRIAPPGAAEPAQPLPVSLESKSA